jgi:hypothetical protein
MVYLTLVAAVVAGGVLGARRGHGALLAVLGPALGVGLVIAANNLVSNEPLSGAEDLSWRIVLIFVGLVIIPLYLLGFAFGSVWRKYHPAH